MVSCLFPSLLFPGSLSPLLCHALFTHCQCGFLLTVANNNTLPFCALDAVAILLPLSSPVLSTCCFWACFSVCSFVCLFCFVFSVSCCFVLMLCFSTFWLFAALLISCRLFYRHFLSHSQNCIYTYNMYFYLYKVYSLVRKANSFLLLVCISQPICMYLCIGSSVYIYSILSSRVHWLENDFPPTLQSPIASV